MEKNNRISLIDVVTTTKDLCEFVTGEEYEVSRVEVNLNDGKPKKYISLIAHKKSEKENLIKDVLESNNKQKKDFKIDNKYCHIATFEKENKSNYISFDDNDEHPIKADFDEKYNYIDHFFKSFIKFRNNLIADKQVVKSDDIYQYFLAITGFPKEKKVLKKKLK